VAASSSATAGPPSAANSPTPAAGATSFMLSIARELGISHALASQHLRKLDAAGLVELAEERRRRGGQERRYRAVRGTPLSDQRDGSRDGGLRLAETLVHMLQIGRAHV